MNANFLTAEDLSKRWGIATHTLSQWRWSSRGPRYMKVGRRILYRLNEIEAFEEHMLRRNTTEIKLGS